MARRIVLQAAALGGFAVTAVLACSADESGSGAGNQPTTGTGGSAGLTGTGGTTTGGKSTGGAFTGGVGTGGTAKGGGSTGGVTGGSPGTGGKATGTGGSISPAGGAGATGTGGATGGMGPMGGTSGGPTGGTQNSGGALGACTNTSAIKAGDQEMKIMVGGTERSFYVHAPPSYDGKTRMPVVFDFHGLGGNPTMQRSLSGWAKHGDQEGFITIHGQGLGNTPGWNAGGCCTTVADDVAFVRAIVERMNTDACIDPKRIHSTGCSNGGAMSYMLACKAADIIASVAPVDFDCVVGSGCSDCDPGRPITVVQFRGTNDTAVPYKGAQPNFANWKEINMCTGDAMPMATNSSCETYPMCGANEETILCTVQDGKHCGSYTSFEIPEVAWNVLKNHPLP